MTQTYGFEIECFGLTPSEIQTAINSVEGACVANPTGLAQFTINPDVVMDRIFGYGESKEVRTRCSRADGISIWMAARDGSIHNTSDRGIGHEIISPILYGQEGINNMKKVVKALSRAGAQVNRTCGVHVHLGLNHYSRVRRFSAAKKNRMLHRIADLYDYFGMGIDTLVPLSRRDGNNSYCRRIQENQARFNVHEDYETRSFSFGRGVFNTLNYTTNGTVEFRQHGGSLNGTKLENWAKLMSKIVGWAINENHPNHRTPFNAQGVWTLPETEFTVSDEVNVLKILCNYLNVEPAHKRALVNRADELGFDSILAANVATVGSGY
jgi:hypothetical protein